MPQPRLSRLDRKLLRLTSELDGLIDEYRQGVDAGIFPDIPLDIDIPEPDTTTPSMPPLDEDIL